MSDKPCSFPGCGKPTAYLTHPDGLGAGWRHVNPDDEAAATNHVGYPMWRGSEHRPERGSDVEAWIKRWRDGLQPSDDVVDHVWTVLDNLLDDYREHADTGTPLTEDVAGPHPEEA